MESRPLVLDAADKQRVDSSCCAFHTQSTMPPRRANANTNTRKLNRQLQTAVVAKDERGVRKAVERGAEVNAVMETGYAHDGFAPLHHAAAIGNEELVWVLFELGAALDMQVHEGTTAVYIASNFGHTETVRTLAQHGANLDTPAKDNATPVWIAALSIAIEKIKQKKNLPRLTWRQNVISRERPKLKCSQSEVTL